MTLKSGAGSHAEKIYAELKHEIDSLILMPDTLLKEVELAARFKVSRTPVRDALSKLSAEGFVNNVGGRGTLVASVSYPEALQAYEIRNLIEPFAASQAAKNKKLHHLIEKYIEQSKNTFPADGNLDPKTREDIDRDFHCLIADVAQNPLIGKIVNEMRSKIRRVFFNSQSNEYWDGQEEHKKILEAIIASNEIAAGEAMSEHLENAKRRIMQIRV